MSSLVSVLQKTNSSTKSGHCTGNMMVPIHKKLTCLKNYLRYKMFLSFSRDDHCTTNFCRLKVHGAFS